MQPLLRPHTLMRECVVTLCGRRTWKIWRGPSNVRSLVLHGDVQHKKLVCITSRTRMVLETTSFPFPHWSACTQNHGASEDTDSGQGPETQSLHTLQLLILSTQLSFQWPCGLSYNTLTNFTTYSTGCFTGKWLRGFISLRPFLGFLSSRTRRISLCWVLTYAPRCRQSCGVLRLDSPHTVISRGQPGVRALGRDVMMQSNLQVASCHFFLFFFLSFLPKQSQV